MWPIVEWPIVWKTFIMLTCLEDQPLSRGMDMVHCLVDNHKMWHTVEWPIVWKTIIMQPIVWWAIIMWPIVEWPIVWKTINMSTCLDDQLWSRGMDMVYCLVDNNKMWHIVEWSIVWKTIIM